jgi:hypothetical protein
MNKKTVMAILIIAGFLLSIVAGIQAVEVAKANPIPFPPAPSTDLPTLVIQPPENFSDTYSSNTLELNFTVTKPYSWDSYGGMLIMPAVGGYIVWVYLDGTLKYHSSNLGSPGILITNYIAVFKNLTLGQHTLKVDILAQAYYNKTYYANQEPGSFNTYESTISQMMFFSIDADSKTIWFVSDPQVTEKQPYPSPLLPLPTPPTLPNYQLKDPITIRLEEPFPMPTISDLSVANQTYYSKNVPLTFNLDEVSPTSIAYSLDEQSNVTIQGNTTLFDVSEGSHSIIIYANSSAGIVGASETVYFNVSLLYSPSLTPSRSPTQQPTPQATQKANPTQNPNTKNSPDSLPLILGLTALAILAAVSTSLIIRKKKAKGQSLG